MENLTHNEDTLNKVMRTLISVGHHTQDEATNIISSLQNAGIKFREVRSEEEVGEIINMGLNDVGITEAVHLSIGAASMAWEEPPTAVFDDQRASEIAQQLVKRIKTEVDAHAGSKDQPTETAEPKEWVERQEEERRAWAVSSAIEAGAADIIGEADKLVKFVKGDKDEDLHDQEALDAFHVELASVIVDEVANDGRTVTSEWLSGVTDKAQDAITEAGVRLKNAKSVTA